MRPRIRTATGRMILRIPAQLRNSLNEEEIGGTYVVAEIKKSSTATGHNSRFIFSRKYFILFLGCSFSAAHLSEMPSGYLELISSNELMKLYPNDQACTLTRLPPAQVYLR